MRAPLSTTLYVPTLHWRCRAEGRIEYRHTNFPGWILTGLNVVVVTGRVVVVELMAVDVVVEVDVSGMVVVVVGVGLGEPLGTKATGR